MEWIRTSEKMPPQGLTVIHCFAHDRSQHIAYWDAEIGEWETGGWESCNYCGGRSRIKLCWANDNSDRNSKFVTHWMPLPKEPENEI